MKVSIVISTYGSNAWKEIARERARPSAEAQNPHEVLVLHEANGTVASCRNRNVGRATGDWICHLDADDELSPTYLSEMERAYTRYRRNDGRPLLLSPAVSYVKGGHRQPARTLSGSDLSKNNFLVVGTLVQRDLFLKVGGFCDYPHGFEDWSLWAKCWKAGAQIVQVRRAVYIAYIDPNSKHRVAWQDREWQVAMHNKIAAELFPEQS